MPDDSQSQKPPFAGPEPATGLLSSRPANFGGDTSPVNWSAASSESAPSPDPSSVQSTVMYNGGAERGTVFLGRYRLERILGRGGMGLVWLAYDPRLARNVAVKIIRPDAKLGPDALAQFLDEGRRLAALNHPEILPIYDCGDENGVWYLVSEFVPGGTLADRLKREPLSFDETAELVARVAEAANFAHMRGLVHRDIKPANILLREDGRPLLADFGLAIAEEEQLREAPGTLGTYAYMAPEQMLGESRFVDGRADIYSLGVVLYQLLAGRLPYLASTPEEYRELVLRRDPRPPRSVREDIPIELEAICLKCLARQPAERYTTAGDLAAALRGRSGRWMPSVKLLAALGAATVVAAFALVWMLNGGRTPADHPEALPPVVPAAAPKRIAADITGDVFPVTALKHSEEPLTWEVTADGGTLSFYADDTALFKLGDYDGGDLDVSVEIEQSRWTGGLGVFWGYRPADGAGGPTHFEILTLYPRVGDNFRLHNALVELPDEKSARGREISWGGHWFKEELEGRPHRLRFVFRDGKISRLAWDELDLTELLAERAAAAKQWNLSLEGGFGLTGKGVGGKFLRAQLNGRSMKFSPVRAKTD